jgi:hypothetical protein
MASKLTYLAEGSIAHVEFSDTVEPQEIINLGQEIFSVFNQTNTWCYMIVDCRNIKKYPIKPLQLQKIMKQVILSDNMRYSYIIGIQPNVATISIDTIVKMINFNFTFVRSKEDALKMIQDFGSYVNLMPANPFQLD